MMMRNSPREVFDAYIDNSLSEGERARLETQLDQDRYLKEEFDDYLRSVELVRGLSWMAAPRRFVLLVQQRIRRRTRGRYFNYSRPPSMVVEAAVCAVLIFVMAALYLVGGPNQPSEDSAPRRDVQRVHLAPADARFLARFGTVELVATELTGSALDVTIRVPSANISGFDDALMAHPRLRAVATTRFRQDGTLHVRVRAPAGPRSETW